MRRSRFNAIVAGLVVGSVMLSACGDDDDDTTVDEGNDNEAAEQADWGNCDPREGAEEIPDPDGTGDDDTTMTLGIFSGWDESYASAYLLQAILQEQGYTVNFTEVEAAATYQGVAGGEIDFTTDGWLPLTHATYLEEFGADLQSLGCWYDNAKLTIAVNEDAPIQSLDELADAADEFGNRLVGIEPSAGLTETTENAVIPTYGLEGMEYLTSSTPAMLSELRAATDAGENVAVTLWRPHWAYDAFPIRDLEDPEGTLGETEYVYSFGRTGFDEDFPNVAQLVRNFVMTDEQLAGLEKLMFSDDHYAGENHEAAVADWIAANPDFVDALKAGTL